MDLKELIKLAEDLDNMDKQELILFLQSRKRTSLCTGRPRTSEEDLLRRSWSGRIRTTKLDQTIGSHLSNSNVLCTDSWRAFSSYANQKDWRITDSNPMENSAPKAFTISRT